MKRTGFTLLGAALAGLVALGGLLFLLSRQSAPATPVAAPTAIAPTSAPQVGPTPTRADGGPVADASPTPPPVATPTPGIPDATIVARVLDVPISRTQWETAAQLDAVMSRLADQPTPSPEETLDRLINEILLLREAGLEGASVASGDVESRIAGLEADWGVSDAQVVSALGQAGLTRQALVDRVARLILVQRAMGTLSARYPDLSAWLAEARRIADVAVYQLPQASPDPEQTPAAGAGSVHAIVPAQSPLPTPTESSSTTLQPGLLAPDFSLASAQGVTVTLSDYRGVSNAVVVFYRGST